MEVHIIVGVWKGILQDLEAFIDIKKARGRRSEMLEGYGLTDEDVPDNQHNPECRWNEENELHLHTIELNEGGLLHSLYHGVERQLSHVLTPGSLDHESKAAEIITARDNVRMVMRKMGWKNQF